MEPSYRDRFCKPFLQSFTSPELQQFQRRNIIWAWQSMLTRLEGSYAWCRVVFAVDTQSPHDGIAREREL